MSTTTPMNPVVQAILNGSAPQQAKLAAASGLLPLAQSDLLEVLVALRLSEDSALAEAAKATLDSQTSDDLLTAAKSAETSTAVLDYVAESSGGDHDLHEAVILNKNTSDKAIAGLASSTPDASILELIAINQQRLVRFPEIIDAILANPARSADAERRARETRKEFFEKERGAQQIAEELRARGEQGVI